MLPLNTMQPVVRDTIPPTFSNDELVSAEVKYGTNVFVSGLKALDEGRDISRDIQYSFEGLPNTFVEGGSLNVLFYLYDGGANYIEQTVTVPIVGGPKYPTPVLFDFEQATEIPEEFTQTNGEWAITESGLQCIGSEPASPRWNIVLDTDAEADIQIEFVPMEAGRVHGVIVRGQNLDDMFYAWYRDGVFTVSDRNTGVTGSYDLYMDETLEVTDTISLGARVEEDTLSFYHGSEKVLEHTDPRLRYARQFGIISSSDQAVYKKLMVGNLNTITFGDYDIANTAPTANAGSHQSVAAGVTVQLDASSSTPGTYPIASYEWTQTAGDTVALEDETTATPTFESPVTTAAQRVSFDVIAIDTDGNRSAAAAVHIDVAAFVTSALLKLLDTRRWELHHDGTVQAFEGRANREAFRFKLIPDDGVLNDADGFFRFDQPGIDSVEVLSSTSSSISSTDDPDMIREVVIAARTGDLKGEDPNNLELTFVLYVTGDSDGLVMTASEMVPYQSASYFRR